MVQDPSGTMVEVLQVVGHLAPEFQVGGADG